MIPVFLRKYKAFRKIRTFEPCHLLQYAFSEMCYSIISSVCIYNWSLCLRRSNRPFPLPLIGFTYERNHIMKRQRYRKSSPRPSHSASSPHSRRVRSLGGMPYAFADPAVMSTVTTDTVSMDGVAGSTDSTASVTGGSFTAQTKLYGGKAITETDARSEAKALRNKLSFTTGHTVKELYGGYVYARPTKTSMSLQANANHLTAKAGADKFYGGYAYGEQQASGTHVPLSTAEANGNIVTIAAGSGIFESESVVEYSFLRAKKTAAVTTAANANNLTIEAAPSRRPSTAARRRRITTMRPVLPRRRYAATSYGRTGARSRGKF